MLVTPSSTRNTALTRIQLHPPRWLRLLVHQRNVHGSLDPTVTAQHRCRVQECFMSAYEWLKTSLKLPSSAPSLHVGRELLYSISPSRSSDQVDSTSRSLPRIPSHVEMEARWRPANGLQGRNKSGSNILRLRSPCPHPHGDGGGIYEEALGSASPTDLEQRVNSAWPHAPHQYTA